MCASTRFPEAIPLRNIKSKTIVKALVKFFTFVGLPMSDQSDQGSLVVLDVVFCYLSLFLLYINIKIGKIDVKC